MVSDVTIQPKPHRKNRRQHHLHDQTHHPHLRRNRHAINTWNQPTAANTPTASNRATPRYPGQTDQSSTRGAAILAHPSIPKISDTDNDRDETARGVIAPSAQSAHLHRHSRTGGRFSGRNVHPEPGDKVAVHPAHPSIPPIRGSDNTRNPRYRQRPGQNGAAHHSPSAKICVIRGSNNTPAEQQPSPSSQKYPLTQQPSPLPLGGRGLG